MRIDIYIRLDSGLAVRFRFEFGTATIENQLDKIHANQYFSTLKDFGQSENVRTVDLLDQLGYLSTLIIVNTPQLILSFVYLIINALHTQLQVEEEWNLYGLLYKPLRVTYPEGQQTSTYRLQLPYKYSVPLIGTSALLHWLVSNSLFILIIDGSRCLRPTIGNDMNADGLAGTDLSWSINRRLSEDFRLPEDTFVGAGYSDMSMLILLIIGAAFVSSPALVMGRRLKSEMVSGGTNSLVLSAACHVPRAPASEGKDHLYPATQHCSCD